MWIPTWLRQLMTRWSNAVELDAAARREKRLSDENIRTHGQLAEALETIRQLRVKAARATGALVVEQRAHDATADRLAKLMAADRKRAAERDLQRELAADRSDAAQQILALQQQLAAVTVERDRARMVQMARYDLDDTAAEKRYMDMVGEPV
jgi:hypothetical protein